MNTKKPPSSYKKKLFFGRKNVPRNPSAKMYKKIQKNVPGNPPDRGFWYILGGCTGVFLVHFRGFYGTFGGFLWYN